MSVFRQAATILTLGSQAYAFSLKTTYDSTNFLDKFNFRDAAYYNPTYPGDPTDGSVNYLSKADALASGIVNTNNNQVYLGVDFNNTAKLLGSSTTKHGRDSVRLESVDTWSSGIMIADIAHMPGTACGVWPAFWSYNFDENPVGEIDIIENINMQTQNIVSLHTCGQCTFTNIGGTDERANCNNGGTISQACEDGTNFDGCGNTMTKGSYGSTFNAAGGGVYATWLEQDALKLYWWKRSDIPADITSGNPDPTKWGTPASQFLSSSSCNVGTYFKDQTIIINTDFCGDSIDQGTWDSTCAASTGAKTCDQYITNNPSAFKDSYWLFNSIKIYN